MGLLDLHGQVAIVTGGAKGIGAATVHMLERAGARVAVFDLQETGGRSVDVTNESQVRAAFASVAGEWGGVDILINNAGRAARKPATELTVEEWQEVMAVNLTASFTCSRTAHPYLKRRGAGA